MNIDELVDKTKKFALNVLAPKAKSWAVKFAIGAGSEAMAGRAEEFIRATGTVDESGNVDVESLHRIVSAGFGTAGHVDVFGGLIGFDPQDAEDLFEFISSEG